MIALVIAGLSAAVVAGCLIGLYELWNRSDDKRWW